MQYAELKHQLPRYRCHKCVSAAKITYLLTHTDGMLDLTVIDDNGNESKIRMSADWNHKHAPDLGGYLVMYDDGYNSYSPASTFEAGYTLLTENEGSDI